MRDILSAAYRNASTEHTAQRLASRLPATPLKHLRMVPSATAHRSLVMELLASQHAMQGTSLAVLLAVILVFTSQQTASQHHARLLRLRMATLEIAVHLWGLLHMEVPAPQLATTDTQSADYPAALLEAFNQRRVVQVCADLPPLTMALLVPAQLG